MRLSQLVWFVTLLIATLSVASAQTAEQLRAYDERLVESLRANDPEAADVFARANEARLASDEPTAIKLYRVVMERAPTFTPAQRRLGMMLASTEKRDEGLALCRKALALEASWENATALATALSTNSPTQAPSTEQLEESTRLALQAMSTAPHEASPAQALCSAAIARGDLKLLEQGVQRLEFVNADPVQALSLRAIFEASRGRFDRAVDALDRARAAGLPDEAYAALSQSFDEARPWTERLVQPALWTLGVWLAALVVLVGAGWWLSRSTLRAAERMPPTPEGSAQGASVRGLYKIVLTACCVYYYVSLPLVLAIVLVAGGTVAYELLQAGRVPIKLVLIAVAVPLVTLWAVIRSLFFMPKEVEPGEPLDLSKHPRLRALLDDVAEKIGTSPVTHVYMTPGTDIAVFERGGMARRVSGRSERCLLLGVGVLDGMSMSSLRSILAHEYGHFSNRDTAGGGFALAVRRSILATAHRMNAGGAATWYNPAWLFLLGFHKVFLFVSQGASRLQEILADRWAAFAYGSKAFEDGLRHVITTTVRFNQHADSTIKEMVREKLPVANLYSHRPARPPDPDAIEREIRETVSRKASLWDSHPSPQDRIRWVRELKIADDASSSAERAWELFSDREKLETQMTSDVVGRLAAQGHVPVGV